MGGPVLLKTAVARVAAGSTTVVNILLDEGAQRSFITQSTADAINLTANRRENIQISAFGGLSGSVRSLQVADFKIQTATGDLPISALIVPTISTPLRNHMSRTVLNLPHIRGLKLAHPYTDCETQEISVLIGADYYWSIVGDHIVRGPGPTAISSKLGYLLSGPTSNKPTSNPAVNVVTALHINNCVDVRSHHDEEIGLHRFWDLETIGIKDSPSTSKREIDCYRETHLRYCDKRYEARLPWKVDHSPLPTNREMATKRTRGMIKRLTPEARDIYDNILRDQLARGFIEEVCDDDVTRGHYLPHRGVEKDSETTPIRIVFDCSAKTRDNPSLNSCLETGEPLLNDLASLMMRFRVHKYGISTDIQKAFLQIGLHEKDREYTKFFWLSDPNNPDSDLKVLQFKVVLFGATCSPFILSATILNHLEKFQSEVARDLSENIYVDNCVSGCDTKWDVLNYYDECNEIMNEGGFKLGTWSTNCQELRDYAKPDGVLESKHVVNVLGTQWDTESDTLSYKCKVYECSDIVTKREVVKIAASLYDPLGFVSAVQIKAKIFIQELWKANYDWDQPLPDELRDKWTCIVAELSAATQIRLPRRYIDSDVLPESADYEIHAYSDASKAAFGSVLYLRRTDGETAIIIAKSRVAPVKELTIPQLELTAAMTAAKLIHYVRSSLGKLIRISKTVLWSDSQITLHWIRSDKKLPVFVTNRVNEIKLKQIDEFKFCPTGDNPADLLSRGVTATELQQSDLWWKGFVAR